MTKKSSYFPLFVRLVSAALAFAVLICTSGCTGQDSPDPSSSQESEAEQSSFPGESQSDVKSEASADSSESSVSSAESEGEETTTKTVTNIAREAALPEGYTCLNDGDIYSGIIFHDGSCKFSMEWESPVDIDRIVSKESGNAIDSVRITAFDSAGGVLAEYSQEECGENRVSALALRGVKRLELSYGASSGEFSLTEVEVYPGKTGSAHGFGVSAYLPVGSALDEEQITPTLRELSDLILISGSSWDANGEVSASDEFVQTREQLKSLLPDGTPVWATVYPSYKLINKGRAGATVDNAEKRAELIDSLLYFVDEYELDGLDFDWEFPGDKSVWSDFSTLLVELKQRRSSLKLSAALYPDKALLSDAAFAALDRVNVMAYDQFDANGHHSTYKTVADIAKTIPYFANNICEVYKLYIGIPAYGRPFDASNVWDLYKDIPVEDRYTNIWKHSYFNGCAIAADKTAYAMQSGFGGVFLYHLSCDRPLDDEFSLLGAIVDYIHFK